MARNLEMWRPRSLMRWEPLRDLRRFEREMDRMREDLMENFNFAAEEPMFQLPFEYSPQCDLEETPTHFLVSLDLPGVSKENIRVECTENDLKITGEKKREHKEETPQRYVSERRYGRFERAISLGENIKPDKIEANFEDGVLRISVPKKEETAPKTQSVKIGEGKPSLWNRLVGKVEEKVESAKKVA